MMKKSIFTVSASSCSSWRRSFVFGNHHPHPIPELSFPRYPFDTAHERTQVLKRLRLATPEFPAGFEKAHPRQSKIISWLLQHDPAKRPSALELLQSTLLPPKLEDEYMKDALRTISDPTTPFYHRLLSELFDAARPMPVESRAEEVLPAPPSYRESVIRHHVVHSIQRLFEHHNGRFTPTSLLNRVESDSSKDTSCHSPGNVKDGT